MADEVEDSYNSTKYFFVSGIEDFNDFRKKISEKFIPLKIGGENGIYSVGKSFVMPMNSHKAILIKNYTEGLDDYIKKEFECELS